jgi:hypothetical protein
MKSSQYSIQMHSQKRLSRLLTVILTLFMSVIGIIVTSCETAVFSSRPPVKHQLETFPDALKGEWSIKKPSYDLYVTRFLCSNDSLYYEMANIAPGVLSPQVLQKGKMELYHHKKDYYLCISGPDFWLPYIIKPNTTNELVVYGFGKETLKHVKLFDADEWEEGLSYTVFHPTQKEWKQLLKSSALKEIGIFQRKK